MSSYIYDPRQNDYFKKVYENYKHLKKTQPFVLNGKRWTNFGSDEEFSKLITPEKNKINKQYTIYRHRSPKKRSSSFSRLGKRKNHRRSRSI
jgi:hypothetical protein